MSTHILHPHGDGDKCVCGVRLSYHASRRAFGHPREMICAGCERCYMRVLRTWQAIDPDITPVPVDWPGWPWDDPRYVNVDAS